MSTCRSLAPFHVSGSIYEKLEMVCDRSPLKPAFLPLKTKTIPQAEIITLIKTQPSSNKRIAGY